MSVLEADHPTTVYQINLTVILITVYVQDYIGFIYTESAKSRNDTAEFAREGTENGGERDEGGI